MSKRKAGKPKGFTRARKEHRIRALMEAIAKGQWKRNTLQRKYSAKWDVTPRTFRLYWTEAENRLKASFEDDFRLSLSIQLNMETALLRRLYRDLDANEESTKQTINTITLQLPGGGTEEVDGARRIQRETLKKTHKGRVGIYSEIGRTLDRISKLKGLHRPDLFDQSDELFEVLELGIGTDAKKGDENPDIDGGGADGSQ